MKEITYKKMFKKRASAPIQSIILIFDLEGFSRFFNQPDVQQYVPIFLNRVFECLKIIIQGGHQYWIIDEPGKRKIKPLVRPIHQKFLGDGGLYIWRTEENQGGFWEENIVYLINRIWNLKKLYKNVLAACADDIPVVELPAKIRFGLAAGTIYKLKYEGSNNVEYIGYPINLASRLQKYCRELGFIASARVNIPQPILDKSGYIKVIAKKLYGFPDEIVIVDKDEYAGLETNREKELFTTIS